MELYFAMPVNGRGLCGMNKVVAANTQAFEKMVNQLLAHTIQEKIDDEKRLEQMRQRPYQQRRRLRK